MGRGMIAGTRALEPLQERLHPFGSGSGPLLSFLLRHPFASFAFLEGAFGEAVLRVLLRSEGGRLRKIEVPELGACYAHRQEPNASLLGCHRREIARRFALACLGPDAVRAGLSPGLEADGEFPGRLGPDIRWWRIWVDLGGCAPEALPFLARPPKAFGDRVRDFILSTDPRRVDLLAAQIERRWTGRRDVHVWLFEGRAHRVARPRASVGAEVWQAPSEEEVQGHIRRRLRGSHHRSRLARLAMELSGADWTLLGEVGGNPLFSPYELAYLAGDDSRNMRREIARIQRLESLQLIETAQDAGLRARCEKRKLLTWRGLELLAEHWGVSLEAMRRLHPWPQREDPRGKGHLEYATGWLRYQEAHQRLTRQFALALLYGGRCVSNARGGVHVHIDTTVGSRIAFSSIAPDGGEEVLWVAPDARLHVAFWRRAFLHGEPLPPRILERRTLFIELDRGTIPAARLEDRMDRYAFIWGSLASQIPALVWVIDGSPYREKQILERMRARGLQGWTVTLERLVLPPEDSWWLQHAPACFSGGGSRVGLRWKAIAGMAPWRPVWRATHLPGHLPFLGLEPWRDRWAGDGEDGGSARRPERRYQAGRKGASPLQKAGSWKTGGT